MSLKRTADQLYPRKRAPIACNFCRRRKRKCDGQKPTCGLCSEAGAQCEYQETSHSRPVDVDAPAEEILQRLNQLENLIQCQADAISKLTRGIKSHSPEERERRDEDQIEESPAVDGNLAGLSPFLPAANGPATSPAPQQPEHLPPPPHDLILPPYTVKTPADDDDDPLTIPLGHQTTTGTLFSLKQIRSLIGDYPQDFFLQLESERRYDPIDELFHSTAAYPLSALDLRREVTDPLVAAFFTHIHPNFPLLDQQIFLPLYELFPRHIDSSCVEDALCLVVIALGKLSASLDEVGHTNSGRGHNGMDYFSAAYHILTTEWMSSFRVKETLPTALLYAAIYLCYLGRPLQTSRFVHMASTSVQFIFAQLNDKMVTQAEHNSISRLAWGCFVLECDGLAEFHLPRSGIEVLVDGMLFPRFADPSDRDGLMFLAVCSVRRLLNRVHNTIYSTGIRGAYATSPARNSNDSWKLTPSGSAMGMEGVCRELLRQVDTWYDSLPEAIKPNLEEPIPRDMHDGWLRLRYWSARHIICRPCLIHVASTMTPEDIPEYVMAYSQICVESCRVYINTSVFLLTKRTQILSCVFVLAVAHSSPLLKSSVPEFHDLVSTAIQSTELWAACDSTSEVILGIMKTIRQKQRLWF
ncbi:hypothetical protein BJY01DRAFT_250877 [Aspergillus pseudoustus]|uniref:Zn(2)-C6 fungal-type domain-containing protein n=1 Tax=Aspergillus pseudoustus TaxID=1810923 RepID=A0ABR4JF26_9EURO